MKLNKTLSAIILAFAGFVLCAQAQRTATAIPTVVNGFVVAITVTDGGAGYTNVPAVNISGGGGSGANATATVLNGAVDKVIVKNAGSGYSGTPVVAIAPPPAPKPPFSDGLLGYYPFNGNANDESDNGNHGVVNGATLMADRFGKTNSAYSFNGIDNFISAVIPNLPAGDAPRTLTAWVKPTKVVSTEASMLSFLGYGAGNWHSQFGLGIEADQKIWFWGGYASFDPSVSVQTNRWTFVALTYSNSTISLSFDGVSYQSDSISLNTVNNGELFFGVTSVDGSQPSVPPGTWVEWFSGGLDDVRIYNRALSDVEVADLYAYEAPEQPSLTINVKTVQVTMHVKPTKKYQLEASLDMNTWTKVGDVFTATTSEVTQEFNTIEVGRFFRLSEVQ
jgi:hypothetical protein